MSFWIDHIQILSHEVLTSSSMRQVVIHQVTEKSMKFVEASFGRSIRRCQTEMPLPNNRRVVACRLEGLR